MLEKLIVEKNVKESSFEKPKIWFRKFLEKMTNKQLLYAYSIAFAGLFSQQVEAMPVVDKTSPEVLDQIDTMSEERFGISISDACKKAGCKIIIQTPSENGKYLVHVSQIHPVPNDSAVYALEFTDYLSSMQNVLDSQKKIYSFLSMLQNPTVIVEGVEDVVSYRYQLAPSSELDPSYMESFYINNKTLIDSGDESSFFIGEREIYNYRISSDSRFLSMPRLDESYDLGKADDAFKYKIGDTYKPIHFKLPYDNDGDRLLYSHGALGKLLIDKKDITVLPGDKTTHGEDSAKMIIANNKYTEAEYYNDRENFAITQALDSEDNMPFVVYGAMHNFAPNLSNINGNYGVIRIETSTSNSKDVLEEVEEVGKN